YLILSLLLLLSTLSCQVFVLLTSPWGVSLKSPSALSSLCHLVMWAGQLLKKIVKINNSSNRVNKQDLELFNNKLQKQQQQNEALQPLVRVDGGVVNEVKLLHKESRNMNSRVTQLYMQLLHEIIHQRDNALEASQMGSLTAGYRDHEHKYQHLSALLEEHCKSHPAHPHLPVICPPSQPFHPHTHKHCTSNSMTNEIQNDQNSKDLPSSSPTMSSATFSIHCRTPAGPFKDCLQVLKSGYTTSYMYLLKPEKSTDPNSQTVIQRRQDGSVNCFGNIDIEYWLRLENIYWLTNQGNYKLLVNLEDWRGQKTFAEYASFRVESEGNAGDSLTWHNNRNCAHYYKGGCILYLGGHHRSRYHDGVYWIKFRGGAYSLWKVSMMIQPNANTVD
uniref:Fibrinogen C-terminal domain-containing protein n=1 Tax=Mola mola TaxID=94237 RepID=A0A3Q3WVB9_MOLML